MGWRLLLTRPAQESAALAATLAEHGIYSSSLPLLAIEALSESAEQRAALADLQRYCAVIVVSKPAARLALDLLDRYQTPVPTEQPWFSVGAATAQILRGHDLQVYYPEEADDSEALLALPQLQQALTAAASPRVLILRGESGRELLAERLRGQGVQVDYLPLYRRVLPDYPSAALIERIQAERLNALVVSSGQGFVHLRELAAESWAELAQLPLFVPSPRVAEMARAAGAQFVVDCRGASAAALLAALQTQPAPISDAKDGYVSEATTPKEQGPNDHAVKQPEQAPLDTAAALPATPPVASQPASRGNGLALLALLVAAAGAGAGGWGLWQLQEARSEAQSLAQTGKKLEVRLDQLPSVEELETRRRLLAQLQGQQQLLNQRLETVLGASRQDWRLAEAEHLLRLASLRLSALQDINSATALVQAADEILHEQDDPAAFAAREQLAMSLQALRSTANPDRTGLFLQLGALREQVAQLNAQAPSFSADGGVLSELADSGVVEQQWWQRGLQTLSEYFRIDFNADRNIRPVLAGQSLTQVRLSLSLALEQAQWGALHGKSEVYCQALQQAREVLDAHFDVDNPNSRALSARIDELAERPIAVTPPDLSPTLNAVQAYIQAKQTARSQQKVEAEPAAAPSDDVEAQLQEALQ
ncbi:uroporphyrinogen III methyltransferase / synthase [Pseudomonas anguilliseptica]|uniref:Uroporphyrinogen III methyltransferase / synthase n=1 Tax=Pseudomonas anguilliseptica TaxID=53406 RepID=A0A1H4UIX1_PSEAG|nr:uroporphyrinogen III methyltransferase / synthase [Pseudomonas anguilliseptica]